MKLSLKVGQPDIVDGKDGLDIRGVIWRDPLPGASYFVMKWEAAGEILTLELDAGTIAWELKAAVGAALEGIANVSTGENPSKSGRQVVRWNIRGDYVAVSERIGEVLGMDWEKAVGRLLTTTSRNDRQQPATLWYGIPREQIPWFPTLDLEKCDGCGRCLEHCEYRVFQMSGEPARPVVVNPLNCVVGCDSCARDCRAAAIQFPPREILQTIRSAMSREGR